MTSKLIMRTAILTLACVLVACSNDRDSSAGNAILAIICTSLPDMPACHVPYRQEDHRSFEEEWAPHDDWGGWWYGTGILHDINDPEHLYAYQYTVFHFTPTMVSAIKQTPMPMFAAVQPLIQSLSTTVPVYLNSLTLIDLQTGQRMMTLKPGLENLNTYANQNTVAVGQDSQLIRGEDSMTLSAQTKNMQFEFELDMGKGAFWHADNGVLVMACQDVSIARTVYYSYTNMPTTGSLIFTNEAGEEVTLQVEGQSWFDRQWGSMGVANGGMFWEWFSLRFFDDEEVMLFAFPQSGYQDGTYIDAAENTQIFNNYTYSTEELWVNSFDNTFSWGWDLTMPGIKEEHYRIVPMIDKPVDEPLWLEVPAQILNADNKVVGYAFVELIPGARNDMPDPCLN